MLVECINYLLKTLHNLITAAEVYFSRVSFLGHDTRSSLTRQGKYCNLSELCSEENELVNEGSFEIPST